MSRKHGHADSLDLLLDTICNTFGGILFIALIIVILLSLSTSKVNSTTPSAEVIDELAKAEHEHQTSLSQLQALRVAVEQLEKTQSQFSPDPETLRLATRLKRMELTHQAESKRRDQDLKTLAESRRKVNELLEEMARLEQAIHATEKEVVVVDAELKREMQIRSQTATLPKQRATRKLQVGLLLKHGRLYAYHDIGPNGSLIHNASETVVRTVNNEEVIEPIPTAGLSISPTQTDDAQLKNRLSKFDRNRHFMAVVVWPDSFPHFGVVRQTLVNAGLEYQLIPWSGEQPLTVGSPTGSQFVQ